MNMSKAMHQNKKLQLWLGLIIGILFGFLLQKGGVTHYDVILGQLLLKDFTVLKIMLTATVTGMIGIYFFKSRGWVNLHPKPGSVGMDIIGGLLFGVGFAILGYCPGTVAGAAGSGYLDALIGGLVGMLVGAGLFAALYPRLSRGILKKGDFGAVTFPELLKVNPWVMVFVFSAFIAGSLLLLEAAGL
jgi:hypothetical protein